MRSSLPIVPPAEMGLSYVRTFDRHRCDLVGIGLAEQRDPRTYRWDNRGRSAGVLLQITLDGEGRFAAGRREWAVPVGMGFLVEMPSATRYWLPYDRHWRFVWAIMAGDAALDHARRIVADHGHVLPLPPTAAPTELLLGLHRRVIERGSLDELTVNIEAHRLLLELARALTSPTVDPPPEVAAAVALIEARYADPRLDVDDLAATAGYSRYHFSRLFKQHTGQSPYQHLLRVRLRRALQLLTTTDVAVKQVAGRVGFKDVSWFCSAFRKQMGTTPGAVRRQQRRLTVDEVFTI